VTSIRGVSRRYRNCLSSQCGPARSPKGCSDETSRNQVRCRLVAPGAGQNRLGVAQTSRRAPSSLRPCPTRRNKAGRSYSRAQAALTGAAGQTLAADAKEFRLDDCDTKGMHMPRLIRFMRRATPPCRSPPDHAAAFSPAASTMSLTERIPINGRWHQRPGRRRREPLSSWPALLHLVVRTAR
jgi:hypothetical protein